MMPRKATLPQNKINEVASRHLISRIYTAEAGGLVINFNGKSTDMNYLSPYLSFNGKCREAMKFYQDCLGGDLQMQKVSEMPEMAKQMPESYKDSILHSMLTSGPIVIMASDLSRDKPVMGNTTHLCLNCSTENEIRSLFSNLSAGGQVTEPLKDMPWNALYGAITDKFGTQWVFNYDKAQKN